MTKLNLIDELRAETKRAQRRVWEKDPNQGISFGIHASSFVAKPDNLAKLTKKQLNSLIILISNVERLRS